MADCDYNYDNNSPRPSPPPADGCPDHLKHASISDLFLYLRSRAKSGPADDHSRQGQHQQQMYVTNIGHRKRPDGTTLRRAIVSDRPLCPGAAATAPSPRHPHRANTAATPYHRHECWSNRGRRRSPAPPHDDDDEGATKLVCLAKMIPPSDSLEDDRFYQRWSNRGRRRSPAPHDDDEEGATKLVCLAKMFPLSDSLEDDGFYQRWIKRGRRRSWAPLHGDDKGATKVVCLAKMLSPRDRLEDDGFYQHFLENVTKEARKFGDLVKVVIPRPGPGTEGSGAASVVAGVGKVFLEYTHLDDAAWCRKWYGGGKAIDAAFFPQDRFDVGDYDYDG